MTKNGVTKSGHMPIDTVMEAWTDFVLPELGRRSSPLHALVAKALPVSYDDGVLVAGLPAEEGGFLEMIEAPSNLALITTVVQEALPGTLSVWFYVFEHEKPSSPPTVGDVVIQRTKGVEDKIRAFLGTAVSQLEMDLETVQEMLVFAYQRMWYTDYLKTNHWQRLKVQIHARDHETCQLCGRTDVPLDVHHKTYERRGQELLEDLILICRDCHGHYHKGAKHAKETA